jgi:predicted RNase H-like HicB family nuclease
MSHEYLVVYEGGGNSYSAYVPDLPGCVAAGRSLSQVKKLIREAIAMHIEGMEEDGLPIPKPTTLAELVPAKVA